MKHLKLVDLDARDEIRGGDFLLNGWTHLDCSTERDGETRVRQVWNQRNPQQCWWTSKIWLKRWSARHDDASARQTTCSTSFFCRWECGHGETYCRRRCRFHPAVRPRWPQSGPARRSGSWHQSRQKQKLWLDLWFQIDLHGQPDGWRRRWSDEKTNNDESGIYIHFRQD